MSCETYRLFYTALMTKSSKCRAYLPALAAVLLGAGCGGFSGSRSVSPASFLLPGLMQAPTPPPAPAVAQEPLLANATLGDR